jgi:hypothetical protein
MTTIPASRTQLTFKELMVRWGWDENDMRDAMINQGLVPSYFISGAVWQRPSNKAGERPRAGATSVYESLYLVSFHETGALDGYFDRCAREPDSIDKNGDIFEVGGIGVVKSRVSLADVLQNGMVMMAELDRFENSQQNLKSADCDKPLEKRERDTLLTIIAVVCKEAGLDYKKHAKTAGMLVSSAAEMDISIGETTIEGHLKRIPDALASRMK